MITLEQIGNIVEQKLALPDNSIYIKRRKREIVEGRQIAMYCAYKISEYRLYKNKLEKNGYANQRKKAGAWSLSEIGEHFAGRDHATVLNACKTVNNLIDTNKQFANDIDEILKKVFDAEKYVLTVTKEEITHAIMQGMIKLINKWKNSASVVAEGHLLENIILQSPLNITLYVKPQGRNASLEIKYEQKPS